MLRIYGIGLLCLKLLSLMEVLKGATRQPSASLSIRGSGLRGVEAARDSDNHGRD